MATGDKTIRMIESHSDYRNRNGFTLLELLVVITIILVLTGLLFPAVQSVLGGAKKAQAKNDLTQIVTAVSAYYAEYGKYPIATDDTVLSDADTSRLFNTLRAIGSTADNPRQIAFISPPEDSTQLYPGGKIGSDGRFCDPWGTPYKVAIDGDYSGFIANPYGGSGGAGADPVRQGVIAWSLGKNGALGGGGVESGMSGTYTGSGDVISWQ